MIVKRSLQVTGVVLLALFAVLAVKTISYGEAGKTLIEPATPASIDTAEAAGRLADMVRFKTISVAPEAPVAAAAFRELHAYIQDSFPNIHMKLEREIVSDFSLLYRWQGSDPTLKPVLLMAHTDVVPIEPGTLADWTHAPFGGVIADGFIWGRGTLDMKVSVAGILEAVEHLLGQGLQPTRTIYLAFSHDEEVGGPKGTVSIVRTLDERGIQLLFTIDEGMPITHGLVPGVTRPVALIGLAEKGRVSLKVTARGEGGHSSLPPLSTAVGKLGRALDQLESNQFPAHLQSPTIEMFEKLAPEFALSRRAVLANSWISKPLILSMLEKSPAGNATVRTTTAPTIINGGFKPNVIPTQATAIVDFRILPGDTVKSVKEHVQSTISTADITFEETGNKSRDPTQISDSNAASYQLIEQTIRQVFPEVAVAPGLVIGGTDSRHYSPIADNSFRFLPIRLGEDELKRMHGIDERVATDNYAEIIQFYIKLISNVAGTDP